MAARPPDYWPFDTFTGERVGGQLDVLPCSYVIQKVNSCYEAVNGSTGKIDYGGSGNAGGVDGTDAAAVIQAAIDAADYGRIFVKKGRYPLSSTPTISGGQRITIEGEAAGTGGTQFDVWSAIDAFKFHADTSSILNPVLKNVEIHGHDLGSRGIYFTRDGSSEVVQILLETVWICGFNVGIEFLGNSYATLINCVTEYGHTDKIGIKYEGGVAVLTKHWFEQLTLGLDLYGSTFVTLIEPKWSGGLTTRFDITEKDGYTPQIKIISTESKYENSGTSTGTGAQQTIAHGLATTPDRVFLSNEDDGANPYQSASADATNIYITAVDTKKYQWKAWKAW